MQSSPARPAQTAVSYERTAHSMPPTSRNGLRASSTPGSVRQRLSFYDQDPSRFSTPQTPQSMQHELENDPEAAKALQRSRIRLASRWFDIEDKAKDRMEEDSDDDEVDLETMTVYKRGGRIEPWRPRETPIDSGTDDSDAEGSVSLEEDDEVDDDKDELDDWSEQEDEVRNQQILQRMRSTSRALPVNKGPSDEDLAEFERFEALYRASRPNSERLSMASSPVSARRDSSEKDPKAPKQQQRIDPRQWGTRFTPRLSDLFGSDVSSGEDELASSPPIHLPSSPHKPSVSDEEDPTPINLNSHMYEDVIAGARALRLGRIPLDPPSNPALTFATAHGHLSGNANQASSSRSPAPAYTFWKHREDFPAPDTLAVSRKGKERMSGERPSETATTPGREAVTPLSAGQPRESTAKKGHRKQRASAAATPLSSVPPTSAVEDAETSPDSLDPYYYRRKTYTLKGGQNVRRCRPCGEAGGLRALRAVYCRGNVGHTECRFNKPRTPPASEPPQSRAAPLTDDERPDVAVHSEPTQRRETAPVAQDQVTPKERRPPRPKQQIASAPAAPVDLEPQTSIHTPQQTSDTAFDPQTLDAKRYCPTRLWWTDRKQWRKCGYCRQSDDPFRKQREEYCRGRISAIHCTFDSDKGPLRKSRKSIESVKRVQSVKSDTPAVAVIPVPSTAPPQERARALPSPESPFFDRPHILHHGGRTHCKACRTAGGRRAEKSALCRGRQGVSHCLFETQLATSPNMAVSESTSKHTSVPAPQKRKRSKTPKLPSLGSTTTSTAKSAKPVSGVLAIDSTTSDADDDVFAAHKHSVPSAAFLAGSSTHSGLAKGMEAGPARKVKIARPRPRASFPPTTSTITAKTARKPDTQAGSTHRPAPLAQAARPHRGFDIIIPIRKVKSARRNQSEPAVAESTKAASPAGSSPLIQPQRLEFGGNRTKHASPLARTAADRLSSPLPASSPPPEPLERPVRPTPPKPTFRPTPPAQIAYRFDQSRYRSESVSSSSSRPVKSSLRQSSEMDDTPRAPKRARFSLTPQFQDDDPLADPRQSRTVPSRMKPDDAYPDSDSSEDELLLTDSISSLPPTSTPHSTGDGFASSSAGRVRPNLRPDWSPHEARFPPNVRDRHSVTPVRSGLMLPPPVPQQHVTPAPIARQLVRSEPRPAAGVTSQRRRATSLSQGVREKVLVSNARAALSVGTDVR